MKFLTALVLIFLGARPAIGNPEQASFYVRRIPVSGADEARRVLGDQEKYYRLLFQQQRLPYGAFERWDPACLSAQIPGKIREDGKNLSLSVQTTADQSGNEGACGFAGNLTVFILFSYCENERHVSFYKFTSDPRGLSLCK